jgi:hypothetical protein
MSIEAPISHLIPSDVLLGRDVDHFELGETQGGLPFTTIVMKPGYDSPFGRFHHYDGEGKPVLMHTVAGKFVIPPEVPDDELERKSKYVVPVHVAPIALESIHNLSPHINTADFVLPCREAETGDNS